MCEISSEEVFQSAGVCGREIEQPSSIRNWIHVKYSCYGDIPGVVCSPAVPAEPTTAGKAAAKAEGEVKWSLGAVPTPH